MCIARTTNHTRTIIHVNSPSLLTASDLKTEGPGGTGEEQEGVPAPLGGRGSTSLLFDLLSSVHFHTKPRLQLVPAPHWQGFIISSLNQLSSYRSNQLSYNALVQSPVLESSISHSIGHKIPSKWNWYSSGEKRGNDISANGKRWEVKMGGHTGFPGRCLEAEGQRSGVGRTLAGSGRVLSI